MQLSFFPYVYPSIYLISHPCIHHSPLYIYIWLYSETYTYMYIYIYVQPSQLVFCFIYPSLYIYPSLSLSLSLSLYIYIYIYIWLYVYIRRPFQRRACWTPLCHLTSTSRHIDKPISTYRYTDISTRHIDIPI